MPAESLYSLYCKKENAHEDPIYCVVWTTIKPTGGSNAPPQDYIVSGGLDGHLKVWKLNDKKFELFHSLGDHVLAIISIAISPDGHTIATTSLDSHLILWDTIPGKKIRDVTNGGPDTWKVKFSPDGNNIVASGHTGKLAVYNIEQNRVIQYLDTREKFAVCVAWSNDSKHIASGSINGKASIFNVAQGKLMHCLDLHTHTVTCVDFSPNSKLLVTGSKDGCLKLFDVESGNNLYSNYMQHWVLNVGFSPDGTRIVSGNSGGQVVVTTVEGLKRIYSFQEHSSMVFGVQFNPKGNKVVSIAKDQNICLYECPIPKSED
ncbi:WD repeat-containing protein 61-like [Zerene cesonia]|uniref:WD repeat-containing protein 61-like n=1 Tax=Zerene cesonia TaxID=33412 RepID=UPI0018E4DC01|nr:WD repeat-containing protein 61-like [Zerene cesonia]